MRHQSDNYNLKTRVGNLEKLVRHQSDSADSNLVETLENRIKQDLMQEMGRLKTDITDKVDKITTSNAILNSIFTSLKTKVEQEMGELKTDSTNLQQNMEGLAEKVQYNTLRMDGVNTKLKSLVEKVTNMETSIKINSYRVHTINEWTGIRTTSSPLEPDPEDGQRSFQ